MWRLQFIPLTFIKRSLVKQQPICLVRHKLHRDCATLVGDQLLQVYKRITLECPGGTLALGSPEVPPTLADDPLRNSIVARASVQTGIACGTVLFLWDDSRVDASQNNIHRHQGQRASWGGDLAIVATYHSECRRRLNFVAAFSNLLLFVGTCINANTSDRSICKFAN